MALRLSILIATMPSRLNMLDELLAVLNPQVTDEIEVILDPIITYNIGTKRNKLLHRAIGDYVVFIDDDDMITPDYCKKLLEGLKTSPDCLGISGIITTNGKNEKQWHISKKYGRWFEDKNIYYRTPNHISPVKRELALKVGFPAIKFGEDAEYSRRLLRLLKTEVTVEGNIYHYQYRTK